MTAAARCLLRDGTCPWSVTGTPEQVDRAARVHVGELAGGPRPGHPVLQSGVAS